MPPKPLAHVPIHENEIVWHSEARSPGTPIVFPHLIVLPEQRTLAEALLCHRCHPRMPPFTNEILGALC